MQYPRLGNGLVQAVTVLVRSYVSLDGNYYLYIRILQCNVDVMQCNAYANVDVRLREYLRATGFRAVVV